MNIIAGNEMMDLEFEVNGQLVSMRTEPDRRLLDILRDELGLIGAKEGCGVGVCGACTVLMNGDPVNSCLVPAIQVQGTRIETIEGLQKEDQVHPLQKSFIENNAVGCGFCTPGAIMSAKALLDKNPSPSDDQIREAMSGNLCRCTGYDSFVNAVRALRNVEPDDETPAVP